MGVVGTVGVVGVVGTVGVVGVVVVGVVGVVTGGSVVLLSTAIVRVRTLALLPAPSRASISSVCWPSANRVVSTSRASVVVSGQGAGLAYGSRQSAI